MIRKILPVILAFCCIATAFSLELRLNGGTNKWGFASRHNALSMKWDGSAPITITLKCELFNTPGANRPALPWQSWFGILMEDGANRYIAGLLCPGNRTPEVDYGAIVYEKKGNFSMKNDGQKLKLAAGPLCLRLVFDNNTLTLFAGKDEAALSEVWTRTAPDGFQPKKIGVALDSAQAKSTLDRIAIHSFRIQAAGKDDELRFDDLQKWQTELLTLELIDARVESQYKDITETLKKQLSGKLVSMPAGDYTFGEVKIPANSALRFESGSKIRVTGRTNLILTGDHCTIEGGLWFFPNGGKSNAVISGKGISGVTIRGVVSANYGEENPVRNRFNFAEFDACADILAENNRIAGVKDVFSFYNCRRVSVLNNKAMHCDRITSFRNSSEFLQHSGNWSQHVTHQCQWWGGDANDTKKNVRDNTARIMIRDVKPGDKNYYEETAGTYDIQVSNNIAEYGTCLAWGSKGRNVVISGNIARYMGDMAYDTEGGENIVITGNLSINSKCVGIGAYFYGSRLLIANNQILVLEEGDKKYQGGFLRLHSGGKNTHFGNGKVLITGNQFINEVNPKASLNIESARNVVLSGNSFIGGGIAMIAEAENIAITGNSFETSELMINPVISFNGNASSRRIIRDNIFLNSGKISHPAIRADKRHNGGTLIIGNNLFEGFSREAELQGTGTLKGQDEHSAEWERENW